MARLEGKVAVITGAASGIGRASAQLFIEEGARVVIADVMEDRGNPLADELGENAVFLRVDVSQEDDVRQSDLDWTIVRPAAFTDGNRTGEYRHGFPGNDKTTKLKVSRDDVAEFILKQLTHEEYLRKTPGLSY